MIPFSSQRGLGQDLATHLQNTHDNESMELAHLRGAIAKDLNGAFAEWELQADALTNCKNYLYSLSINPDPTQDGLTREQYLDYIERTEQALGLADQPRAIVFHVKHEREHAHVVWSRIDPEAGKAIHLAFDHDKLMRVTRQFARDHDIELPDGYTRDPADRDKAKQLSLYEKHQQDSTGLTKEERMELITDLWRKSDSAKALVQALGENGYMLANGKRPYVLVDIYGDTHSLPKLIDDKSIRTKDVRAFLERDYPPESLPSVEEAKKLAIQHRKSIEQFEKVRVEKDQTAEIDARNAERRKKVLEKIRILKSRQLGEKRRLEVHQKKARMELKARHLTEVKRVRSQRKKVKAKGLAAFLGRVTGMNVVIRKLQRLKDQKRYEKYQVEKQILTTRQTRGMDRLRERHRMQVLDIKRQVRAVNKVEKRELKSKETARIKTARIRHRARKNVEHMPAINMKRYEAVRAKVKSVERNVEKEERKPESKTLDQWRSGIVRLTDLFTRASDEDNGDDGKEGRESFGGPKVKGPDQEQIEKRRRQDRDHDPGR